MRRAFAIAAVLVLVGGVAVWRMTRDNGASASFLGYVEGETLYIGPTEGERVERLAVESGSVVEKGDLIFVMATPLLDRQREEGAARIAQMEAQLANARAAMNRPQQIAVLEAAVERARASLAYAEADYKRQKALYAKGDASKATLDRAAMTLSRDRASLDEAEKQVAAARMPSRTQEIEAAEAALKQARAQLALLDVRIARQSVRAPASGVVQDIYFRPGEMVNAGQPVVALLPPENRKVRFYASEPKMTLVKLGREVKVNCDGCADDLYGRISYVASREEYTPPVIFSDAERAKLVFKAEARLEGKARELPLGLPVSVTLLPEAGAAK